MFPELILILLLGLIIQRRKQWLIIALNQWSRWCHILTSIMLLFFSIHWLILHNIICRITSGHLLVDSNSFQQMFFQNWRISSVVWPIEIRRWHLFLDACENFIYTTFRVCVFEICSWAHAEWVYLLSYCQYLLVGGISLWVLLLIDIVFFCKIGKVIGFLIVFLLVQIQLLVGSTVFSNFIHALELILFNFLSRNIYFGLILCYVQIACWTCCIIWNIWSLLCHRILVVCAKTRNLVFLDSNLLFALKVHLKISWNIRHLGRL